MTDTGVIEAEVHPRQTRNHDAVSNARSRRPRSLLLGAGALGAALIALHLAAPDGLIRDWTYLAVAVGASAVAWVGATHHRAGKSASLLALGLSLSALGDVLYQAYEWTRSEIPEVSIADLGWLGAYVAIVAALLRVLRSDSGQRLDIEGWIDVAVVFVIGMLIQWEVAFHDIISDTTVPVFSRLVWSLYPVCDSMVLALLVRAVASRRLQGRAAALMASGAVCWLVSDFAYTLLAPEGAVTVWLNAGWLVGAMLLAAAAWQPTRSTEQRALASANADQVGYGRVAVALVPLLIPGAIEISSYANGTATNPLPRFAATAVLVGLAYARSARLLRAESEARAVVRSQERLATTIAANSSDALIIVDAERRILNDAWQLAALVGYEGVDTRGVDAFELVPAVDRDDVQVMFDRALTAPGQPFETEARVRHSAGHDLWVAVRIVNLLDDPDVGGVIVNIHEVTDRKRAEADLVHQAFHDSLTGLANRALFSDRVEQALRRTHRTGLDPAVIFLDLDGFKLVNDTLGHGAGDELLCEVARRLLDAVRSVDTVARMGGDEFAILIEQSHRPIDEAEAVAERILLALSIPITLGDQGVSVGASLGIAVGDGEAVAAAMLRDADVAMYRAKSSGKGQVIVFDPEMRAAAVERLMLESDLLGALDAEQLELVYQPVVELESGRIVGFEALLRWNHPTLGVVMPDRFIPLAEETGLIVPMGAWVLREACKTTARWHREHPEHGALSIAVNVSARQVSSSELLAHVADALETSGLDPALLVVEMTESALVRDAPAAALRLHELRALGIRLAIDDFGTGYSSLSYLRQFPVDILKIDRSFIESITDRDQVPAIVRGLLDLGRTLELETVAEGVEQDVQRDWLRDEHCHLAQGFLFARPLDVEDADPLLQQLKPTTVSATG